MAYEFIDKLSENVRKLSDRELDALTRQPAAAAPPPAGKIPTVPGITVQPTVYNDADAKLRPIEMPSDYKFELKQTAPYMENANRAIEQRQADKGYLSQNAQMAYEDQKKAEISYLQAVQDLQKSREPYKTPDWLSAALEKEKSKSDAPEKAPDRSLLAEAILAFSPGLAGMLGGESAALAAPEAQKQGRNLYETYRKEELDQVKDRNKSVTDKYEKLAKIDKAYADKWFNEQKLSADQAKAVVEGLKLPITVSQKDSLEMTNQANAAGKEVITNTMTGAAKVADLETLPMREANKTNRAKIVATGQGLKDATKLRQEFENSPEIKTFRQMQPSYDKLVAVSKDPSAAGDISMVYSFMKMQDPNSAILPGEYATAENAGNANDRVRNIYNKLVSGEFLTKSQRADFVNQAKNIYNAQQKRVADKEKDFSYLAEQYGTGVKNVIPRVSQQVEKEAGPAAPGFGPDKAKRLEELRKKRDAGKLGQ